MSPLSPLLAGTIAAIAAMAASLLTCLVYRPVAERGRVPLAAKVAALEATVRARDEEFRRGRAREDGYAITITELRDRVTTLDRDAARLDAEPKRERDGAAEDAELPARAVGSPESRVLPTARELKRLGAAAGDEIPVVVRVEKTARAIVVPELAGAMSTDALVAD